MHSKKQGLYDPGYEHDACGVGFVVNVDGKRDHKIIDQGIQILCKFRYYVILNIAVRSEEI
jgi:glutamate synthase domain-containing protein 1